MVRRQLTPDRAVLGLVLASGLLDVTANLFYVMGSQRGLLSLVSVITSLYPVGTVVLARLVLAERLVRVQQVGVVLALAGIALIAIG